MSLLCFRFLRSQNEYNPPQDLNNKLETIFTTIIGTTKPDTKITDLNKRFQLFAACFDQFRHSIPNSQLHCIETLKDVAEFYATAIDVRTPLDKMRTMDLPENLHVQFEYHRFHPGENYH